MAAARIHTDRLGHDGADDERADHENSRECRPKQFVKVVVDVAVVPECKWSTIMGVGW
jgi:hypothetical protein